MRAAFANGSATSLLVGPLLSGSGAAAILGWALFAGALPGDRAVSLVGIVAVLASLGGILLVGLPRIDLPGATALGCLGLLTAWAATSIAWSIASDRSWDAANLGLAALAFGALGLAVGAAAPGRAARIAGTAIALVVGLAVGWALLGLVVPSLFPGGDLVARLREPIGHAPALALVAGAAIPLAGWLLAGSRRSLTWHAGVVLAYAATVATMLTQSRAGVIAALVVALLWGALAGGPLARLATLLPAVVPGLVVAGVAYTQHALVDDGSARPDRVHAGWIFAPVLVVGVIVAVVLSRRLEAGALVRRHRAVARKVAGALATAGLAGVVVALAVGTSGFSGGECANDPSRLLGACANNRLDWWSEAWHVFTAHPLGGTGALTFSVARTRVRDGSFDVVEPNSVPLQLLADLGFVGFVVAAAGVVALAFALRAVFRRLEGDERVAAAALVAFPVAFGIHGFFDYDADFLAVVAPTVFAVAALLSAGRPARRLGAGLAPVVAVAAGIAVASLVLPYLAASALDGASRASDAGKTAKAARLARRAESLDPLSLAARFAQADVAVDDTVAERVLLEATRLQPENAATWYELGVYRYSLAERRDSCGAYDALNHAYTLDPMSRRWVKGGLLDQARDDVNLRRACG